MKKLLGVNTALVSVVAIIAIFAGILIQTNKTPEFEKLVVLTAPRSLDTPVFTTHLNTKTNTDFFKGKWSIVFFGFTNCPDICPTTLQTLKRVKDDLAQQALEDYYQIVMVSVDPERDNISQLASYVSFFDREFIGLSADKATTEAFAKQVGVLFFAQEKDNNGWYDVDHSASLILLNPNGEWAGAITTPHKQATISKDLISLAQFAGQTIAPISATNTINTQNKDSKNAAPTTGPIEIKHAWIRSAPPTANTMAAYFELHNHSDQDIQIVDSNSPNFDATMIHNTVIENGIAQMQHMDALLVPANGYVKLEPLGKHMMLMRPETRLSDGDSATIHLITDQGLKISTDIPIQTAPDTN